jgi:hypothetical protein
MGVGTSSSTATSSQPKHTQKEQDPQWTPGMPNRRGKTYHLKHCGSADATFSSCRLNEEGFMRTGIDVNKTELACAILFAVLNFVGDHHAL